MMANRDPRSDHKGDVPAASFGTVYPNIAAWVQDGWVEIGRDDYSESFVRALDSGGLVWEGKSCYASLHEALHDLDEGIGAWIENHGG